MHQSFVFFFSWEFKITKKTNKIKLLTGMSFLSFLTGTSGGMVDCCRSAAASFSLLCGEFSPLPVTTTAAQRVTQKVRDV